MKLMKLFKNKHKLSQKENIIGHILSIVTLSITFGILVPQMILTLFSSIFAAMIILLIYINSNDLYKLSQRDNNDKIQTKEIQAF